MLDYKLKLLSIFKTGSVYVFSLESIMSGLNPYDYRDYFVKFEFLNVSLNYRLFTLQFRYLLMFWPSFGELLELFCICRSLPSDI